MKNQHNPKFGNAYPTSENYADLYAKYLEGDRTEQMLSLASKIKGNRVVDLCGGGGRLTMMLCNAEASGVWYVDQSEAMANAIKKHFGFKMIISPIDEFLKNFDFINADVLFCQQAINYWLTEETVKDLARFMRCGAEFIFNTFNICPPPFPKPKVYELNGAQYMELSWSVQDSDGSTMIEHIQIKEGNESHKTRFYWISPEQYQEWLSPYFEIKEYREGPTSIYKIVRNDEKVI